MFYISWYEYIIYIYKMHPNPHTHIYNWNDHPILILELEHAISKSCKCEWCSPMYSVDSSWDAGLRWKLSISRLTVPAFWYSKMLSQQAMEPVGEYIPSLQVYLCVYFTSLWTRIRWDHNRRLRSTSLLDEQKMFWYFLNKKTNRNSENHNHQDYGLWLPWEDREKNVKTSSGSATADSSVSRGPKGISLSSWAQEMIHSPCKQNTGPN